MKIGKHPYMVYTQLRDSNIWIPHAQFWTKRDAKNFVKECKKINPERKYKLIPVKKIIKQRENGVN